MMARGGQHQPLIPSPFNLNADWQHTRIAATLTPSCNRQFTSCAQAIDRTPVTLAKNPPWQLRLADTCLGTHAKAAGARLNDAVGQAAAAFWFFFAAEKELGHAPSMRGSIKFKNFKSLSIRVNVPIQPKRQQINTSTNHSKIY